MKNRHTDTNHHRRLYLPEHPAELQEPLRLYLSGKSITEAADLIGCERKTAAKTVVKQTGMPFPNAHNLNVKPNQFVDQLSTPFYYEDYDRFLE